jgi:hypothetical protein
VYNSVKMTTSCAIKNGSTVYVVDPTQIRWFECSRDNDELTLFYNNGSMKTLKHPNICKVYRDLMLHFNILDVEDYGRV